MATTVKLIVDVNEQDVITKLANIDSKATEISGKTHKLNFEVSGLENLQKTLNSISTSMAQFASANGGATQGITQMGEAYKHVTIDADGAKKQIDYFKDSVIQTRKVVQDGNKTIIETTQDFSKLGKTNEEVGKSVKSLDDKFGSLTRKMSEYEGTGKYKQGTFDGLRASAEEYRVELDNIYKAYKNDGDVNKFTQGVENLNDKYKDLRTTLGETARDTNNLTKAQNLLGDSLGNIVAKIVAWQVINATVATVIRSFKEAVQAIKDVDTELTNIQKVTDATDAQMRKLGDTAFETASKYGISAQEYLNSASVFAKAGFDNYEMLAELSTKTQLVGDVTADVASKFLTSASAAYDYKGNVEELSKVLDAANIIENNYATSIEKIAEGFPIVASTASMANMSIEELVAALGTITSVTQESGTKAATALRALILNIMGKVGEEVEEGVEITEESVKSLDDLLNKFAPDAVKAAEATGKIIDPIEAIRSLAMAAQEGLMTEAELADFLSSLGGKLRTNQLSALVNNFGMFDEMLQKVQNSAGSADKEVQTMLGSWESKTNILKNTWTEFINNFVNTDVVKGGLDIITGAIKLLDSDVGHFITTLGLVVGAAALAETALKKIGSATAISNIGNGIKSITGWISGLVSGSIDLNVAMTALNSTLFASPLFWVAAGTTAVVGIVKLVDKLTVNFEEQAEIVKELNAEYDTMFGTGSEYDTLIKKTEELTEAEKIRLFVLEAQEEALRNKLALETQAEYDAYAVENSTDFYFTREGYALGRINKSNKLEREVSDITANFAENRTAEGYLEATDALGGLVAEYADYYNQLLEYQNKGVELDSDARHFIYTYQDLAATYNSLTKEVEDTTNAIEGETNALEENGNAADELGDKLDRAKARLKAFNDALSGGERDDTANSYDEAYDKFLKDWTSGRKNSNLAKAAIELFFSEAQIEAANYDYSALGNELSSGIFKSVFADEAGRGYIEAFAAYVNEHQAEIGDAIRVIDTGEAYQVIYQSTQAVAEALNMDVDAAEALLEALGVFEKPTKEVKDNADEAKDKAKDLVDYAKKNPVEIKAKDSVTPVINTLRSELRSFESEFSNVNVSVNANKNVTTKNSKGFSGTSGSFANGGVSSGGMALVNELGAELISENGRAYIANGGKPAIVNLSQGAIVLNAQQTADALGTSGLTSSIKAYASGSSAYNDYLISTASSSKPNTTKIVHADPALAVTQSQRVATVNKTTDTVAVASITTTSGGSVGSSSSGSSSSSSSKDEIKDALDLVLDNLDARAELAENERNYSEEAKLYKDAQEEINKAIERYLQAGYAETSTEVVNLKNKLYDYTEQIAEIENKGWQDLEDVLDEQLDNLDDQIELAENQGNHAKVLELYGEAQDKIAALLEQYRAAGYASDSPEVVALSNLGYKYAKDQMSYAEDIQDDLWDNLIDAIKALTEEEKDANALAEKQLAVDKAREAYENAQRQRTVRIFNTATGQWEWIADQGAMQKASESLQSAQKSLRDEQLSQTIDALEKSKGNGVVISPALADVFAGKSEEDLRPLANALQAYYGGTSYLGSTTPNSAFTSNDSHDTVYTFPGGITLTQEQAENTTLADLAKQLQVLNIT